jgi:hypothetical protein
MRVGVKVKSDEGRVERGGGSDVSATRSLQYEAMGFNVYVIHV